PTPARSNSTVTDRLSINEISSDQLDELYDRAEQAEKRLRLAHQTRRAKEQQLDDIRRAMCDTEIIQDDDPFGHADLADVIRHMGPTEPERHGAKVADLEQQLAQLRAGEEEGYDPLAMPTPGQWLARFNEATAVERLDVVKQIIGDNERARRCFLMAHEQRLDEGRTAWVAVARVRDVIADMERITGARHWARILRTAVDGEPAHVPSSPAATEATETASNTARP
ncbi:hypothetical protein ACFVWR_19090, partial [Leifsonia sp. NPDC058292]|uniref:hypothetical protein n=1 Tax=Leifsonia sp. NPDC058292 TaxID=3346428 RepID=UPI0036DD43FE